MTKANAYDAFLTGATTLIENNVPLVGSCAFVSSDFTRTSRRIQALSETAICRRKF